MANTLFVITASQGGPGGSGGVLEVSQTGHGFTVVGTPVYNNGTVFAKAQADTAAHAEVVGVVGEIVDVDNFVLNLPGSIVENLTGFTTGETYFLSAVTAGALTTTPVDPVLYIDKPVLTGLSTTTALVRDLRGVATPTGERKKDFLAATFNGGGAVISAGEVAWVPIAYSGIITGWDMSNDYSGSAVVDIWHCARANFPADSGDSITASAKPTMTSTRMASGDSDDVSTWSPLTFEAGDYFFFHVDSASTMTKLVVALLTERA